MENNFYSQLPKALPKGETERLIVEYRKTNEENIKEKILNHNLRLVAKTIHYYFSSNANDLFDDMFSVGIKGLQDSIELFDPNKGRTFSSYAVPAIRRKILRFLQLEEKHKNVVSLDMPIESEYGELNSTLIEFIPSDEDIMEEQTDKILSEERIKIINRFLEGLPPLHREVFIKVWGIGCKKRTYREVAKEVGFSLGRIEQIASKTMFKLKKYLIRNGGLSSEEKQILRSEIQWLPEK